MKEFTIGSRPLGAHHPPFIIAEMSGNHNQSLERAMAILEAAAEAGAHAIKLQTYTADTLTIDQHGGLFDITDKGSPWYGKNLYQLYEEAHTPWAWHAPLFQRARELGMVVFSSPFDETAVDFLEELSVPAYKIASFESNHLPLLKKVAQTGKPVLISSGASRLDELYESIRYLQSCGAENVVVFKCTSTYPAEAKLSNLRTIPVLQSIFPDCVIGLSDHTLGIGASLGAIALGARVIEKHLTLRRSDGGVDSAFSLEPAELQTLVTESERVFRALGTVQLDTQQAELKSRQFRRSIYVVRPVQRGTSFTPDNIRVIRPGDGLPPRFFPYVLGKKARQDLPKGHPLSWEDI